MKVQKSTFFNCLILKVDFECYLLTYFFGWKNFFSILLFGKEMKLLSWVSKHHDPLSTVPEGEVRLAKTSALFFPLLKCLSPLHPTSNLCEPLFLQKWLLKSPYLTNPISQLQPTTFVLSLPVSPSLERI